ncbi:hypothetical protein PV08_00942 [Exophiala spinifera]|uniref:Uncharacterized protein n=1 Tax=Exophiala spinifera TaxID=91928 RepID=A0A0D2A6F6_9EURO|nr:uncharacterized protein PV08_00942 [Exophiala spinifera]KIW20367.1 hypothetical protein PV08_00942 [Exophiala spinifera]
MGQLGDLSPQGTIAVGIVVGLLSTSIQSLGLTLQRKSHIIEDAKEDLETRRPPYKRRKWQLGMFMFLISNIVGSTIQITTLPLPVLSTLQASGLVFNTAFATLLLGEPFTRFSLLGTILTCSGAALIATFGAIGEPAHNLQQLLNLLRQKSFIIWMVGTMIVAVATILFAHVLRMWSSNRHIAQSLPKSERPRSVSSSSRPQLSLTTSFTAQLPSHLKIRVNRLRLIRGLSYALISGILSAHSLLVAKSAVELLVRTIVDHNNQFNRFQSWLILIALLFFALTQLYYLHLGLRLCSTSVLYPFVFCVYNIIAILDGLIYFQQASRLSVLHGCLVALGTVILLLGVLALSWRLDDITPSEAAPQAVPPRTPLTPGLGLVQSASDDQPSYLANGRKGSSTSLKRTSVDEQTPLLGGRPSAATGSTRRISATDTEGIWAQLDDEERQDDYLASLPRAPGPFFSLKNPKTRRRGGSGSSQAISTGSRPSSSGSKVEGQTDDANTSDILPKGVDGSKRSSSSAPQTGTGALYHQGGRQSSTSVRFADDEDRKTGPKRASRSRFDQGGGNADSS